MRKSKPALKTLSALTAGGALLLGVTLWTSSGSQSLSKPDTPLKVALVLDCITQPRFQEEMQNFGMSRMLPTAGGHLAAGQLMLPTQKDRDLLKMAANSRRAFAIGFFHCAHLPGKSVPALKIPTSSQAPAVRPGKPTVTVGAVEGVAPAPIYREPAEKLTLVYSGLAPLYKAEPKTANVQMTNLFKQMGKAAQSALPILMQGRGAEQEAGDWLVVTRPVRAMKTSCLKCHQGAKQGDTLGVLTYIVSKKTFAAVTPTTQKGGF